VLRKERGHDVCKVNHLSILGQIYQIDTSIHGLKVRLPIITRPFGLGSSTLKSLLASADATIRKV
jgi:hypothetical protein